MPVVVVAGASTPLNATVVWQQVKPVVSAFGSAAGFPAINVTDPATWSSWRGTVASSWVKYDFGTSITIDAAGIAAHDMFSKGVTLVAIQYSTDDINYSNVATLAPTNNEDILFLFPTTSARYWRVFPVGPVCNIGVVQIGKRLIFPSGPLDDYTPLNMAREYTKMVNMSVKGQNLNNRVIAAGASTEVDMGPMERDWVNTNLPSFKSHYDQGGTFFYAGCPSKYPLDMGYCWADGQDATIAVSYIEADKLATVSFPVRSYVAQ